MQGRTAYCLLVFVRWLFAQFAEGSLRLGGNKHQKHYQEARLDVYYQNICSKIQIYLNMKLHFKGMSQLMLFKDSHANSQPIVNSGGACAAVSIGSRFSATLVRFRFHPVRILSAHNKSFHAPCTLNNRVIPLFHSALYPHCTGSGPAAPPPPGP